MSARPPNILLLIADQLAPPAMGAYGADPSPTPNLDALAARGTRLSDVYTPCPVCMPARAAFWTGRHPHETGVPDNGRKRRIPDSMPTLGTLLAPAGYRMLHLGKMHDCGGLRGMEVAEGQWDPVDDVPPWKAYGDTQEDRASTRRAVEFLRQAGPDPYLLVVDYNNPHDICLWIGDHEGAHVDEPVPGPLPPLPANFTTGDEASRPLTIRRNCCSNPRVAQTQHWTPENFRHYLAAYRHYVTRLDQEVGAVLAALAQRPDADQTLVMLLADHGEGMASHRLVTKGGTLYEEVARVPWVVAGPGVRRGAACGGVPVSTLDLVPTLIEAAGLAPAEGLRGCSLLPWLRGGSAPVGREAIVSYWQGSEIYFTPARLVRTRRYAYIHYREDQAEELFDLETDPGQTRNLAADPAHAGVLAEHRRLLNEHVRRTGDPYFEYVVVLPANRRTHADGACPFVRFNMP